MKKDRNRGFGILSFVFFVILVMYVYFNMDFYAVATNNETTINIYENGSTGSGEIFTAADGSLYPGGSMEKTFNIINRCSFTNTISSLELRDMIVKDDMGNKIEPASEKYSDFLKYVEFTLSQGSDILFKGSFNNLVNKANAPYGNAVCVLTAGEGKQIKASVSMNVEAGNDIQGLNSNFNMVMNIGGQGHQDDPDPQIPPNNGGNTLPPGPQPPDSTTEQPAIPGATDQNQPPANTDNTAQIGDQIPGSGTVSTLPPASQENPKPADTPQGEEAKDNTTQNPPESQTDNDTVVHHENSRPDNQTDSDSEFNVVNSDNESMSGDEAAAGNDTYTDENEKLQNDSMPPGTEVGDDNEAPGFNNPSSGTNTNPPPSGLNNNKNNVSAGTKSTGSGAARTPSQEKTNIKTTRNTKSKSTNTKAVTTSSSSSGRFKYKKGSEQTKAKHVVKSKGNIKLKGEKIIHNVSTDKVKSNAKDKIKINSSSSSKKKENVKSNTGSNKIKNGKKQEYIRNAEIIKPMVKVPQSKKTIITVISNLIKRWLHYLPLH